MFDMASQNSSTDEKLTPPRVWKSTLMRIKTPQSKLEQMKSEDAAQSVSSIIPEYVTQAIVERNPALKRLQMDLLVLTSLPDNSTLHWRPSWFQQKPFASRMWTLHNPPNVVTERMPNSPGKPQLHTRRMRCEADSSPYIKDWHHWARYCTMYGVPNDFLNDKMMQLLRLGLETTEDGELCEPPAWPLYPEPQPEQTGRYILDPHCYHLLPKKFGTLDPGQVIVVHSSGQLEVTESEPYYFHPSQWTHYSGNGAYIDDEFYDADPDAAKKVQGKGRRWSHIPWTSQQEVSSRPFTLKLRFWNSYKEYPDIAATAPKEIKKEEMDKEVEGYKAKKRNIQELEDVEGCEATKKVKVLEAVLVKPQRMDEGYMS